MILSDGPLSKLQLQIPKGQRLSTSPRKMLTKSSMPRSPCQLGGKWRTGKGPSLFTSRALLARAKLPFWIHSRYGPATFRMAAHRLALFSRLQKYPMMDILPEPLDKWTNLNGTDMLQLVYANAKRWSTAMVIHGHDMSCMIWWPNHSFFLGILCPTDHAGRAFENGLHSERHGEVTS